MFKENNTHSYCHRLSQHYIICSRDTKHKNYFVIARTLPWVYILFTFETNKKYHIARITLQRICLRMMEFKEAYIIRLSVLHSSIYSYCILLYILFPTEGVGVLFTKHVCVLWLRVSVRIIIYVYNICADTIDLYNMTDKINTIIVYLSRTDWMSKRKNEKKNRTRTVSSATAVHITTSYAAYTCIVFRYKYTYINL